MTKIARGKFRFLYLLALAQLVGGPLVLLHVTLFATLTIREAPRVGIVQAVAEAWASPAFQESITTAALPWKDSMKSEKHDGKVKLKPDFPAVPVFPWNTESPGYANPTAFCGGQYHLRTWTPFWPHAPPGPPPRIA